MTGNARAPRERGPAGLPDDVAALLAAVVDGLTVPHANRVADVETHTELLEHRASDVRVAVEAVLKGSGVADVTELLNEWIAEHPITYTPFTATDERDGGTS